MGRWTAVVRERTMWDDPLSIFLGGMGGLQLGLLKISSLDKYTNSSYGSYHHPTPGFQILRRYPPIKMQPRAAPHLSESNDPGKTDFVMRNPGKPTLTTHNPTNPLVLFFSIFGSLMFAITAFCAYCLWRGPTRAFAPCIKKRSKPIKPHAERGDDLRDPDGILSPDRAPGPNLAFWRSSRAASSGDWGHQVYLTDLKRQAEAEGERDLKGGMRYDEEAVKYASGGSPVERPKSSLSGQRKSGGMGIGMGRGPMSASPLGRNADRERDRSRNSSPRSSTLSHSRLIKPHPQHRQLSPSSALSSTPSSASLAHQSTHARAMSPASTILPNPALPPRHSSLYSPMSAPLFSYHNPIPPPRTHDSALFSPVPSSSATSYMSPPPPGRYSSVAVNVPPVVKMAYSPFTPRHSTSVPAGRGEGSQRDSIRSERGYAV
jgi:hypothetical protein